VFTADDTALLQWAADRAAVAVQSMRARDDQAAVLALQRSLVPSALPALAAVEVAARYVPGSGHVGGDWYDVFTLPSGRLGLVVGDVAGSGLAAAVVMGRIRSALRAYALEFPGPADVLAKLDRKMQYFEESPIMATVCYAVLDPGSGQLAISSAGHLPPVIAAPGQHAELAEITVDIPIGITSHSGHQVTTLPLAPGAVLCLYTDGLVERRYEHIDDGITRLCQAVTSEPPEDVCATVMQTLVGHQSPGDDIALLVLRWVPGSPSS
jgi:phosphoserine phosphatase RsbU/P